MKCRVTQQFLDENFLKGSLEFTDHNFEEKNCHIEGINFHEFF